MQPGSTAADEAIDAAAPDERPVLILTLFRLHRADEPDNAMLNRLAAEVQRAERAGDERQTRDDSERLKRRILLSAGAVQRFLAAQG